MLSVGTEMVRGNEKETDGEFKCLVCMFAVTPHGLSNLTEECFGEE